MVYIVLNMQTVCAGGRGGCGDQGAQTVPQVRRRQGVHGHSLETGMCVINIESVCYSTSIKSFI